MKNGDVPQVQALLEDKRVDIDFQLFPVSFSKQQGSQASVLVVWNHIGVYICVCVSTTSMPGTSVACILVR